jgi:hypothetical protein
LHGVSLRSAGTNLMFRGRQIDPWDVDRFTPKKKVADRLKSLIVLLVIGHVYKRLDERGK